MGKNNVYLCLSLPKRYFCKSQENEAKKAVTSRND